METPKIAIIISTFNQEKLLIKCLETLKKTDYKNYKVFFIDDSGKGKIGKSIREDFKKIDVTTNKKNLGFAGANNIGMKKAQKKYNPDYFLLLNDDTEIVDKDWLKEMVKVGESDEKIGILGCKVVYPSGKLQWPKKVKENNEVDEVIGCCILIKKNVFDKIGFLDEKFNPAYGEESDFCFRASKKGFKLVYVENAKIIHHGSSSTKTLFNEKIWFIKKRNAIRLEWLNHSFGSILKYTFIHLGSSILSKQPFKRSKLLFKAYLVNKKNFKEIKQKRKERSL